MHKFPLSADRSNYRDPQLVRMQRIRDDQPQLVHIQYLSCKAHHKKRRRNEPEDRGTYCWKCLRDQSLLPKDAWVLCGHSHPIPSSKKRAPPPPDGFLSWTHSLLWFFINCLNDHLHVKQSLFQWYKCFCHPQGLKSTASKHRSPEWNL